MLLVLIIILVLIGSAVISSIYSNFMAFYLNFEESENYHRAYYAAISALERGELVVKQRRPGYVGSGGFILGSGQGYNNGGSDSGFSGFSYLGEHMDRSTVFWSVNSRTTRIPATGQGNVEGMLSADDSENYNMMNYEDAENFLLHYDSSGGNPYDHNVSAVTKSSISTPIQGEIRLPKLLYDSGFGLLNTGLALVGRDGQVPKDDAIVDWQVKGKWDTTNSSYTIYSTQRFNGDKVTYQNDTIFRESDINNTLTFNFGNTRNPINSISHGTNKPITIISKYDSIIKATTGFKHTFIDPHSLDNQITFNLINLLKAQTNKIYPFLEYYIDFGTDVSDKYYTINAEGEYKDYQINIVMKKPTFKGSIFANFTSIF